MADQPIVDVNMFVHNSENTVGAAIESVLAQTWPAWRLTIINDGSTDGTAEIARNMSATHPNIQVKTLRCNGGAVASFQRAFWHGDADFILPKSGDDLLAPDFIEKTMAILLEHPATAMCHAAGLIFQGQADVRSVYPPSHCLHAVGPDRLARAHHVMAHYTSSPSFWGVYRRDAVDRLARIRYRAGWDHALLAELALYGEIRHVPQPLYWRRDGGKPILSLARSSTERAGRGLDVDDPITDPHWRTPLITTVLAHLETFAVARVAAQERETLWRTTRAVFRSRWLPAMRREAAALHAAMPAILERAAAGSAMDQAWIKADLDHRWRIVDILLSERDCAATSDIPTSGHVGCPRIVEIA